MRFLPSRVLFSVVWTFSAASRSDRTGRIAQHSIWSSDWGTICAEAWLSGLSPLQCWTALWRVLHPQGHSWKMMEVDVGIDMNRLSILIRYYIGPHYFSCWVHCKTEGFRDDRPLGPVGVCRDVDSSTFGLPGGSRWIEHIWGWLSSMWFVWFNLIQSN